MIRKLYMKSEEYRFLEVEIINGIGWLRLNRTQDENKVDLSMAMDIRKACDQFMQDDNIRVVVISGIGNVFCNGDAQTETILSYTEKMGLYLITISNQDQDIQPFFHHILSLPRNTEQSLI